MIFHENEYVYNPECNCVICEHGGEVPVGTPNNGHSFGYGNPHRPPSVLPPRPFPSAFNPDRVAP